MFLKKRKKLNGKNSVFKKQETEIKETALSLVNYQTYLIWREWHLNVFSKKIYHKIFVVKYFT